MVSELFGSKHFGANYNLLGLAPAISSITFSVGITATLYVLIFGFYLGTIRKSITYKETQGTHTAHTSSLSFPPFLLSSFPLLFHPSPTFPICVPCCLPLTPSVQIRTQPRRTLLKEDMHRYVNLLNGLLGGS